jgi:hypothetical protein
VETALEERLGSTDHMEQGFLEHRTNTKVLLFVFFYLFLFSSEK